MSNIRQKILDNINSKDFDREYWYDLCQEAEQALFKILHYSKDKESTKKLENMIVELNNIRMDQYRESKEDLNEGFNFIPKSRTQSFSYKKVKRHIDNKLKENSLKEGNFKDKKITTNLHNDNINPVWIIGNISINDDTYRVNAKVYLEDSKFGIDRGPVSKLYIADKNDNCIVNYDRGWDIKPTPEYEEIYNIALGAVKSFRNDNPYEADSEPVNEAADPNEEIVNKALNYINNEYNELGSDDRYFLLSNLRGSGNAINKIKKALNYIEHEYNEIGSDDRYFLTNILSAAKIEEPKEKVKKEPKEKVKKEPKEKKPAGPTKKSQVLDKFDSCLNDAFVYSIPGNEGTIRFKARNAKIGLNAQMQSKKLDGDNFALSFNNTAANRFLDKLEPLYSLAKDKYKVNLGKSFKEDFLFYVYDMSQIEEMSKIIESILLPKENINESINNFDLPEGYPDEVYDEYFKYTKDIDLVNDEPLDFKEWYNKFYNTFYTCMNCDKEFTKDQMTFGNNCPYCKSGDIVKDKYKD